MINDNNAAFIQAMRQRTQKLEREGDCWDDAEHSWLKELFEQGCGLSKIALLLQRTEPAVYQQIEKLDLYQRKAYPCRQKGNAKTPVCLCDTCDQYKSLCPRYNACDCRQEG